MLFFFSYLFDLSKKFDFKNKIFVEKKTFTINLKLGSIKHQTNHNL